MPRTIEITDETWEILREIDYVSKKKGCINYSDQSRLESAILFYTNRIGIHKEMGKVRRERKEAERNGLGI